MISINGTPITPTVFPDRTTQVWRLPEKLLDILYKENFAEVEWSFEYEHEIMHLAQLKTLLDTYVDAVHLRMPYCPYARQDKRVSNGSTFALRSFAQLLNAMDFDMVKVLDFHNKSRIHLINNVEELRVSDYINDAIEESGPTVILYPDLGAVKRYAHSKYGRLPYVHAEKDRDQDTGYIRGVNIVGFVRGKRILMIDDLCDGGMTFKLVAEAALKSGAKNVDLYVTHGIFSKGLKTLRDSGINKIFTWRGEVKAAKIEEAVK